MHGVAGCWFRGPQRSTGCRYLFFFLRNRENSLVFFLWGRTGHGSLHFGEMPNAEGGPFLCSLHQPFHSEEGEGAKASPDLLEVRRGLNGPWACCQP